MLAPETVERIRDLLAEGRMSQRGVARALRVSRGTVDAIACGRRPAYPARIRQGLPGPDSPSGPRERCPGCGGMVEMPCLACRLRALREHRRRSA